MVECVGRLTAERDPHPVVYGLLVRALTSIEAGEPPARTAVTFGMRCVDALGHRLRLDRCVVCGDRLPRPGGAALDVAGGGVVCPRCAAATPGALAVSAGGPAARCAGCATCSWPEAMATPLRRGRGRTAPGPRGPRGPPQRPSASSRRASWGGGQAPGGRSHDDLPGSAARPAALLGRPRLRDPAALRPRGGRGNHAPRHVPARPRPRALEGRLRPALAPPHRRPVRREPEPAPAPPPVPGDPQAVARRRPGSSTSRACEALGIDPLRHDIRFVEDDWESPALGAWGLGLGGVARRHGDHPVHLLPAGGRHRPAARSRPRSPTGSSASPCTSPTWSRSTTLPGRRV